MALTMLLVFVERERVQLWNSAALRMKVVHTVQVLFSEFSLGILL